MGYETKFLLTHNSDKELDLIDASYYQVEYDEETDPIKWYDHHTDMMVHSAKYPDVTFTLVGEGEESGDFWLARYLGGVVIEEKRGSTLIAFEELTRKKMEDEIINQLTGVFSPDDVVFILGGVKRAFDKLGVE
jgi:hypothetical protein